MSLSLSWVTVDNTVKRRFGNDPYRHLRDLFASVAPKRRIHKKTKLLNKQLSKCVHIKNYEQYVRTKLDVIKKIDDFRKNEYKESLDDAYSCGSKKKKVHGSSEREERTTTSEFMTSDRLEKTINNESVMNLDHSLKSQPKQKSSRKASTEGNVYESKDVFSTNDDGKISPTSLRSGRLSPFFQSANENNGNIENSVDLEEDTFDLRMEQCESEERDFENVNEEVGDTHGVTYIPQEEFRRFEINCINVGEQSDAKEHKENNVPIKESAPRITSTEIVTNLRYRIIATDTETEDEMDKDKNIAFQKEFHASSHEHSRWQTVVDVRIDESNTLKDSVNDEKRKEEVEHQDEGKKETEDTDNEFKLTLDEDEKITNITENISKSRNLNVANESESLKYVLSKLRSNTVRNEEHWNNELYSLNEGNEHEEKDEDRNGENENAPLFFQRRPVELREFVKGTRGRFEEIENPPVRKMERFSENDQIWILDIPKSIILKADELRGEDFVLKNKTLKIGGNTFSYKNREFEEQVSCCLSINGAKKIFNVVNVNTVSSMLVRKKRKRNSNIAKEKAATPSPNNVQLRGPFL